MNFNSIEQALAFIQNTIVPQVLETSVADVAKSTGEKHVQADVYDAYQSSYERTNKLKESWETELISNDTLQMTNTRTDGDRYIPEIIEYGHGYYSQELDERIGARPFIENTRSELEAGVAKQAVIQGLESLLGKGNVF